MQGINLEHVGQALSAISAPNASPEQVAVANAFLQTCETNPAFPAALLSLYSSSPHPQLQLATILLLTNVLKRNWSSRTRGRNPIVILPENDKKDLRTDILAAYTLHDMQHSKHLNELLKYLTRVDFPNNYPQLAESTLSWINQVSQLLNDNPAAISTPKPLLVLATVKTVTKEYALKKVSHNQENFLKFMAPIVAQASLLASQLHAAVRTRVSEGKGDDVVQLLECLRKADKVVMYSLSSMPAGYQYREDTSAVLRGVVERISEFDRLLDMVSGELRIQAEKYVQAMTEQASRMMNYYPFMFRPFLAEYLQLLLHLLVTRIPAGAYSLQRSLSTIVLANFKPFTTFAYYMTPDEFKGSIYSRKSGSTDNELTHLQCHNSFKAVFAPAAIEQLLLTMLTSVMACKAIVSSRRDELEEDCLEDTELAVADQVSQPSPYDQCVTYCKHLIKCFRKQTRPLVLRMLQELPALRTPAHRQLSTNLFQILLVIPHVYEEQELPISEVCVLLDQLYQDGHYGYLARLMRKYNSYLTQTALVQGFSALAKIVATPPSPQLSPENIYQCALALKTLLAEVEGDVLPVDELGGCVSNLVNIMGDPRFAQNPNLIWPIINLLVKMIKSIPTALGVEQSAAAIQRGLAGMASKEGHEQLMFSALAELFSTLLYLCFQPFKQDYPTSTNTPPKALIQDVNCLGVFQGCFQLVRRNLHNSKADSLETCLRLWLTLLRHFPTLTQQQVYAYDLSPLNLALRQLFQAETNFLLTNDLLLFIEIVEENFLCGLIDLSADQVTSMFASAQQEKEEERQLRLVMATASLYLSYSLLRAPIPALLLRVLHELAAIRDRISPQINCLRSFLMLTIAHHMLNHPIEDIFALFTSANEGSLSWLEPFLASYQLVTSKFSYKLNSAVFLRALSRLGLPFFANALTPAPNPTTTPSNTLDILVKAMVVELQPLEERHVVSGCNNLTRTLLPNEMTPEFMSASYRKTHLHLSRAVPEIMAADLREPFRLHFGALLGLLGWSGVDLERRVGVACAIHVCGLLGWAKPSLDQTQL